MWQLFTGAIALFIQGRLFADQKEAYKRILGAALITACVACPLLLAGLPVWAATISGGLAGGCAAPLLCINLRMR